jgi:hypothetical protein
MSHFQKPNDVVTLCKAEEYVTWEPVTRLKLDHLVGCTRSLEKFTSPYKVRRNGRFGKKESERECVCVRTISKMCGL